MALGGQYLVNDLASYYRVVTIVNFGLGVATGIAMAILGMPQPYLWGIIAALVNYVPYAGPVVGTGVLLIVSLITFDEAIYILLPPLTYVVLTSIEGYFVTPTLVGRALHLNPFMVLLAVVFWGWLWGVPGAFLAVPMLIFMLRLMALPRLMRGVPVRQPAQVMTPLDLEPR